MRPEPLNHISWFLYKYLSNDTKSLHVHKHMTLQNKFLYIGWVPSRTPYLIFFRCLVCFKLANLPFFEFFISEGTLEPPWLPFVSFVPKLTLQQLKIINETDGLTEDGRLWIRIIYIDVSFIYMYIDRTS